MRTALVIAAVLCCAWTRDRVALVVENRSSSPSATAELTPAVTAILESKGYEVIAPAEVEAARQKAGAAEDVIASLRAHALLTVTVRFVLPAEARARGPRANPAFGFAATWIAANGKTWHNALGWIADDVPAPVPFGSRRAPPRPTAMACERLLWSMPRGTPNPDVKVVAAADAPEPQKGPTATRREGPTARQRDFGAGAHFPIRMRKAR